MGGSYIKNVGGVVIGAGATVTGAVAGAGGSAQAAIAQPAAAEVARLIEEVRAGLAELADSDAKRALLEQDVAALRASLSAAAPDQPGFLRAAENIHRAAAFAGGTLQGAANAIAGLKRLAALFGWALPFLA